MTAPTLDIQIDALKALRLDCAARSQVLALGELDGRQLRLAIEAELVDQGKSMTAAEKLAKADSRYLVHERESVRLTYELHRIEAEAEAVAWGLRLQVVVLERVGL